MAFRRLKRKSLFGFKKKIAKTIAEALERSV